MATASHVACLSIIRTTNSASSNSAAGTGSASSWRAEARYAASIGSR